MANPLFSVVIPTYNCARYVGQAVTSALDQTIEKDALEVIVVDDGSTDATKQALEKFDGRVRYFYQSNAGVASARNAGIAMARGTYIAFLDADDYWLPHRLALARSAFAKETHIFLNTELFIECDGTVSSTPYYLGRAQRGLFELDAAAEMEFSIEDNFISSMAIVPHAALDAVGVFDTNFRYGEDWHLWLRLLRSGWAVRLVPTPCAVYRFARPGATTTRHDYGMASDRVRILFEYPEYVSPHRRSVATGMLHHVGLREALRHASLSEAFVHGVHLAANPGYVREVLARRRLARS